MSSPGAGAIAEERRMANVIRVDVKGLVELGDAFRKLTAEMQNKVARQATGSAAQVVRKLARRNIQTSPSIETGSLLDAVIVKKLPASETPPFTSAHAVTVRGRGKKSKKTGRRQASAWYAHFIEFGTVRMPAEPFLGPAIRNGAQDALNAMVEKLRTAIEKANK
jgi:HK97 gp10 family phage protein